MRYFWTDSLFYKRSYMYIYIYEDFSAAIHLYPWINNPQTSWSPSMVDFPCECSKSSDTTLLLRVTRTTNCIKLNLVTKLIPRAFECIFILQAAWLATYTGTAKLDNLPPNNNPSNHLGVLIKLQPKNIYPHIPGINLIWYLRPYLIRELVIQNLIHSLMHQKKWFLST